MNVPFALCYNTESIAIEVARSGKSGSILVVPSLCSSVDSPSDTFWTAVCLSELSEHERNPSPRWIVKNNAYYLQFDFSYFAPPNSCGDINRKSFALFGLPVCFIMAAFVPTGLGLRYFRPCTTPLSYILYFLRLKTIKNLCFSLKTVFSALLHILLDCLFHWLHRRLFPIFAYLDAQVCRTPLSVRF